MSSKLLAISALISAITSVGHTLMGLNEVAPPLQTLLDPVARHAGQNGWWQISGYFLLNGSVTLV